MNKQTIVVIDDDEVCLAATSEILEQAGYRVLTRSRPTGCVAMILQEKPDLVLVDVCMPTIPGDTLVKMLRAAAPRANTTLLLHSVLDEPLLRAKARAAGAHGHVKKGPSPRPLLKAVRQWLSVPLLATKPPLRRASTIDSQARSSRRPDRPQPEPERQYPGTSAVRPRVRHNVSTAAAQVVLPLDAPRAPMVGGTSGVRELYLPTVLFVDDDMLTLSGYRRQLQQEPYQFEFALSGHQALKLAQSETPPQAIVCDLSMPNPDGGEVLRSALDYDNSWRDRFVIVTGLNLHDARERLDRRFVGHILTKPVSAEELSHSIRTALCNSPAEVRRRAGR
jgi:CheY-like chemotaxis protein